LHLFIEECSCDSEWHDPSLLGSSSVSINNPYVSTNKKAGYESLESENNRKTEELNINIYPIPFESDIVVSNLVLNKDVQIIIYSLDQRKVFQQLGRPNNSGIINLQLGQLSPGIYLISVNNGEQNLTLKVIKN